MNGEKAPGRSRSGLFIGRWFRIDFYLDASWFFIAAIVTYTFSMKVFPEALHRAPDSFTLLLGAGSALLFFLSILLHELGHSIVSQRCGIPVPRITLLIYGGLAEISREPDNAKSELKIALAGPIVSVILCVLSFAVAFAANAAGWTAASMVGQLLGQMNLMLVLFNMIPGYPLDGGRVLRAILWSRTGRLWRATYISSRIGIGFSWLLIFGGTYAILAYQWWPGLIYVFIGFFLKSAAETGYMNAIQRDILPGVRVGTVMTASPAIIPDTLPLSLAVEDFFLSGHYVAYPVCAADGEFRGLLQLDFLKAVPREKWPYTTAGDVVAERSSDALRIGVNESAARAMRLLLSPELSRLAVIENGRLVGIVTRHDILNFIEIHTQLEN